MHETPRVSSWLCVLIGGWIALGCGNAAHHAPAGDAGPAGHDAASDAGAGDATPPVADSGQGIHDGAAPEGNDAASDADVVTVPEMDSSPPDAGSAEAGTDTGAGADTGGSVVDSGTGVVDSGGTLDSGTVLATGSWTPQAIVTSAASVYWSTSDTGQLMEIAKTGAAAPTVVYTASAQDTYVHGLAINATTVYWTVWSADTSSSVIESLPVSGGPMAPVATGATAPWEVAANAANVCWTDLGQTTVTCSPVGGGPFTTVASGLTSARELSMDATSVYWIDGQNTVLPSSCALVRGDPTAAASPTTLVPTAPGNLCSYGLDASSIYWWFYNSQAAQNPVLKMPLGGGPSTSVDPAPTLPSSPLLSDGANVYWAAVLDDEVIKLPVTGGAEITLVTSVSTNNAIAVDATNVYFGNSGVGPQGAYGQIVKIAK